jgi:xylulokinase
MSPNDALHIHLGESGVTVTLGEATASSPVETLAREPGWREQRPDDWWDALQAAVAELRPAVDLAQNSHIELTRDLRGWVLLDGDREPIRPAILDGDIRLEPGSPLPWLRQHEPIAYKRIQHILTPKAWLRFRITGDLVADTEDAADLGLLDETQWSDERCRDLGINLDLLPTLGASSRFSIDAEALD